MQLKKRFTIEYVNPNELIPYVKNAKKHPEEQINKIAGQISEFGFDQPIVINKDKIIIKGHGRTLASIKLGLKEVPVITQTLDEYQEMASRIADNKSAESEWDNELLRFDLGTLKLHDFNMDLTGIDTFDVESLIDGDEVEREVGKGIEDYSESHETTDIRQIILIMSADEFDPLMLSLLRVQEKESLDNNTEAVQFLLEHYENSKA